MIIPLFICAIVAGIGYHYSSPKNEEYSYGNMPLPGPKGIPYFGNLFQIGLHQYLTFGKWARMYGPIFEIRLGVKRWVVISDAQIAQELMVKRGANYSARDQSYIMNEIVHPGGRGMLAASGDYWRKIRRLAHNGLAQKPVESYTPFIEKESLELVRTLYGVTMDPENPFRRFGLNIVFTVTFGKRFDDLNDPVLLQLQKVITTTIKHLGYDAIVNILPFLQNLPFIDLNKHVRDNANISFGLMKKFYDEYKDEEARGVAKPCVAGHIKAHLEEEGLNDFDAHNLFVDLFGAGIDTTAITLSWLSALLATHPKIQVRAHAELDAAIGRTRLPHLSDLPQLPYTRAILRESMRFRPPTGWLSIPHQSMNSDVYAGHRIAADTTVVANVFAMNMDPYRYDCPEEFNPNRFIDVHESSAALANGPIARRDHVTFGWGRRICAGIHLAEAEAFVALAQMLWCYRVEVEEDGKAPNINEWQLGITMPPKPFKVRFAPRHEGVREVIFSE